VYYSKPDHSLQSGESINLVAFLDRGLKQPLMEGQIQDAILRLADNPSTWICKR
jgi:hypothetical protein